MSIEFTAMNKYLTKLAISLSVIVALTSCSTSKEFLSIDYLSPAPVTLPKESNHIAVLNNMPNDSSVYYSEILNFTQTTRQDIFSGFISALAEQSYFNQITILDKKWADESAALTNSAKLDEISKNIQPDLIVILGGLNVRDENIIVERDGVAVTSIISIRPKLYIYNVASKKTTSFQPLDSIDLTESIILSALPENVATQVENSSKVQAEYVVGKQIAEYITPHWNTVDRQIYTDTPKFQKATNLFKQNKFNEAIEINKRIFDTDKNTGNRVKAACNIALIHELKDELKTSLEWSRLAQQTIEANTEVSRLNKGSIGELYRYTKKYTKIIETRVQEIQIINLQMSKFEL